jgi:hypothetical protein
LLAGLIDTDGTYKHHGYIITSSNEVLAEGIKRLSESLGFLTNIKKYQTSFGDFRGVAWRVSINGDVWEIPCLIDRKKYLANGVFPRKNKLLSYLDVEDIGIGEYAGFSIDRDHLFCLADGTVTHNSWSFARALLLLGVSRPVRVLCAREVQNSIKDSVHKLLSDQIAILGLGSKYRIMETEIRGTNGTSFSFTGLSSMTVESIKSFEGCDVCFAAGTLVGGVPIEKIKPGDMVESFNHVTNTIELQKVLRTTKTKRDQPLYKTLTMDPGCGIVSTGYHPIYVEGMGYIPVSSLKKGDVVYEKERASRVLKLLGWLWGTNGDSHQGPTSEVSKKWWTLLPGLCEKIKFRKTSFCKSNEESCQSGQNAGIPQKNWAQTIKAWWEWSRIYDSSKQSLQGSGQGLVEGVGNINKGEENGIQSPDELQSGLGKRLLQTGNRNRWRLSYWRYKQGRRQKERPVLREHRVDRVEVLKRHDIKKLGLSDNGNYVYNLEVEINNNYFANGLLVHNCWVEEAQSISDRSWTILIPTIRKDDSEIWISFNPELETDPTYQRFIANKRDDAIIVKTSYKDNPWFNDVMEAERLHCLKTDPEGYKNIWDGDCKPAVSGAIYYKEIQQAQSQNRVCNVPYDPMLKVHLVFDLGWGDSLAISFVQKNLSEIRIINYLEYSQTSLDIVSSDIRNHRHNWGKVWLPHDGFNKTLNAGGKSTEDIMKALGWDVAKKEEISILSVEDGIRNARIMFSRCYFDKGKTDANPDPFVTDGQTVLTHRLVECLKRYRRKINKETETATTPVHDEFSHGADNFRYICANADKMLNEEVRRQRVCHVGYAPLDSVVGY